VLQVIQNSLYFIKDKTT